MTTSTLERIADVISHTKQDCKVCDEDIFFDDGKWKVIIEYYDRFDDETVYCKQSINFCYSCGKDYRRIKLR